MQRKLAQPIVLPAILLTGFPFSATLADGGFFPRLTSAGDLAQVRQEVLLAEQEGKVTYALRSLYSGGVADFAWVIPVPAVPTEVKAHEDASLFYTLDDLTRPTFDLGSRPTSGGCTCSAGDLGGNGRLVNVEASGKAGIFDWAALSSTGGDALTAWLNDNGYAIADSAAPVLDTYIQQEMRFLAVRISDDQAAGASGTGGTYYGTVEIPPIQFTVQTAGLFYPMVISRVSAASETDVTIYVLGPHRVEGANLPTGQVDSALLVEDYGYPSFTNYEKLFTDRLAELGQPALIVEYADTMTMTAGLWPDAPAAMLTGPLYLTRLRTIVSPEQMTQDFELRHAPADTPVSNRFDLSPPETAAANLAAGLLVMSAGTAMIKRRYRSWARSRT